jgi:maleylacetate reductase
MLAERPVTELEFVHETHPGRVVFGAGCLADLGREIERLGSERAVILCSASGRDVAAGAAERLGERSVGIFDRATMHVPIELARTARAFASERGADAAVAIGGGSAIGLGKAIALESAIPIIAVPTTYAGSEMTPIYGLTEAGHKRTGRDPRVLPRTVLYDPELSRTLPPDVSIQSGFNAIAHAAEGLYARDASPITSLMAEEAIRALAGPLPAIRATPDDLALRGRLLYGSWLAGSVLGTVGMAIHHRICHVLGGRLDLPHAATHTVLLPHALAYNADAAPHAMRRIARALDAADAPVALHELALLTGAPTSLRDLGMTDLDVEPAVEEIVANPPWNPRPVEREGIRALLIDALNGRPPGRRREQP